MTTAAPKRVLTVAEYLAAEHSADAKHVLWDGETFAMAGASRTHNRLVAALLRELGNRLLNGPCAPFASDQRVRLGSLQRYVYPDVSVVCGAVETDPLDAETILNPCLLIEVLSSSTEAFDRGDKFRAYRELASLTDYLLVTQHARRIEHYTRQADGSWLLRSYDAGATLPIASLGLTLEVDAVYMGIELAEPAKVPA